ncbi:hypothetical protein [TTV-like mini virus]|uniref:DUF755 domain-containing protein n=1 Tax=TTV-like mini virus TaxID=93678 RepID=M4NVP4_9VIRU|nr:hypothetical protein [TTV-like mini virus]AGG91483.1 hypothetical protein [TTV-like mini virus]
MLFPITSMKQLRYRIQPPDQSTSCTPLTKGGDNLQKKLQNACLKTGKLKKLLYCLQNTDSRSQHKHKPHKRTRPRKKKKRATSSSDSSDSEPSSSSSSAE